MNFCWISFAPNAIAHTCFYVGDIKSIKSPNSSPAQFFSPKHELNGELTVLLVAAEQEVEALEVRSAVEMGSLGDEDFLHRVGVVDDDALGGAQLDAEDVAVFLLEKQKADLEVGPHMFSAFAGYRGSKAWQCPLDYGYWPIGCHPRQLN